MGHRPFSKPVFLKLHSTGNFQARSAWEALEYLDLHWPAARAAHYRQAKRLCHSALEGLVDAEAARTALVEAAVKAGLLAAKWEVDGKPTNTSYVVASVERPAAEFDPDEVSDSDLLGYNSAADVLDDPSVSPSRKKALLSHWASDRLAVAGAPGLRSAKGVTVSLDSLLEAMSKLDSEIDQGAIQRGTARDGDAW